MFELDVALRHIRSRRRQTLFSVVAVALAVMIIVVTISFMSGFQVTLIDMMVESQAHISVSPKENEEYITLYHGLESLALKQEGVDAVSSYYQGEVAFQYKHNVEGALLLGVNPVDENRVMNVEDDIITGSFESLTGPGNHIILGWKLAQNLGVGIGDTVTAQYPGSDPTNFKITGIIQTGTPLDETLAYADLERVQEFYNKGDIITGMGIRVSDIYEAETFANQIDRETDYDAISWMEQNAELLDLLNLQFQMVYIMYILIFAISGFGIANVLIMIVMEKVGEIGMLMAMGTSRRSILSIFLLEAGILGMAGLIIGSILGYLLSLAIASYTIPIPPEMYFGMDHFPVLILPKNFIIAGVFAMVINLIAGVFPARRASKMDPVEAIYSV